MSQRVEREEVRLTLSQLILVHDVLEISVGRIRIFPCSGDMFALGIDVLLVACDVEVECARPTVLC